MAAILPASPLTLQDGFLAALNSGRVVPEDATHVQFANALMGQLASRGCAPMSPEATAAHDLTMAKCGEPVSPQSRRELSRCPVTASRQRLAPRRCVRWPAHPGCAAQSSRDAPNERPTTA